MNALLQVAIIAILCVILQPKIALFAYFLLLGISITERHSHEARVGEYVFFGEKRYKPAKSTSGIVQNAVSLNGQTYRLTIAVHDEPKAIDIDVPTEILGANFFERFSESQKNGDYYMMPLLEFIKKDSRQYIVPVDWQYRNERQEWQGTMMRNNDDNRILEEIVIVIRAVAELLIPVSVILLFVNPQLAVVCIGISIAGIMCFIPNEDNREKHFGIIIPDFHFIFSFLNDSTSSIQKSKPVEPAQEKEEQEVPKIEPKPETHEVKSEAKIAIDNLLKQSDLQKQNIVIQDESKEPIISPQEDTQVAIPQNDESEEGENNTPKESSGAAPCLTDTPKKRKKSGRKKSEEKTSEDNCPKTEQKELPTNTNLFESNSESTPAEDISDASNGVDDVKADTVSSDTGADLDVLPAKMLEEPQEKSKSVHAERAPSSKKRATRRRSSKTASDTKKRKSEESSGQLTFDFVAQHTDDLSEETDSIDETVSDTEVVVLPPKQEHINKYGDSLLKKKKKTIDYEITSYQ